jgi:general secretion pathway protein D
MILFRGVILFVVSFSLFCHTIEDKLKSSNNKEEHSAGPSLQDLHEALKETKNALLDENMRAAHLLTSSDELGAKKVLEDKIQPLKVKMRDLEHQWHNLCRKEGQVNLEEFAPFEMQNASVGKLMIEYGASEYLYVIPPEIMKMTLQVHTNLLISKHSWSHLLEKILHHNGVGVKVINPFTKQLYLLKGDVLSVEAILCNESSLDSCSDDMHIMYVHEPLAENLKGMFYLMDRFRDAKTTFVYQAGSKVISVGAAGDVKNLLCMANKVFHEGDEKITRVVPASKLSAEEMNKILKSFFGSINTHNTSLMVKGTTDLVVLPLVQESCVVLIGAKKIVERAQEILRTTQEQLEDPHQMTIFWYTCRHTTPEDMSEVLDKVYQSLIMSNLESQDKPTQPPRYGAGMYSSHDPMSAGHYSDPYNNSKVEYKGNKLEKKDSKQVNFIPYPMTGSLLMVVRKDILCKIKELVKQLDAPKKMVEIEVLLCERRVNNSNQSGLNFLKMGSSASKERDLGLNYDNSKGSADMGILKFLFSLPKTNHIPAFDLAYNFLMSQDDVRVSASPSITTLNQMPAIFSITDEISINNGAAPIDSNKGVVFEKSFSRSEFGITIELTPTIHEPDHDGCYFVTLNNDITFATIKSDRDDKPNVHKRHIKNQVRIADGQTIILGGLKSKSQEDSYDKIPFLGELPGLGKLFGSSALNDKATEMFIFITPRVIRDAKRDLIESRERVLGVRPSDHKVLMKKIHESQHRLKACFMQKSFESVFGRAVSSTRNF